MTPPPNPKRNEAAPVAHNPPTIMPASNAEHPLLDLALTNRQTPLPTNPSMSDVLDVLDSLMSPRLDIPTHRTRWNGLRAVAISGHNIITYLVTSSFAESRTNAALVARLLVRSGGLIPIFKVQSHNHSFNSGTQSLYVHRGLTSYSSHGLNSLVVFPGEPRPLLAVLHDLSAAFAQVCHLAVEFDGHFVDYSDVRGSVGWRRILSLLSELSTADDSDFDIVSDDAKKACWFNLYNMLIFHAKLVFGHPTDLVKRGKFFNEAAYVVAGKRITSVELEHDVLRLRMADTDDRVAWRLRTKDSRMHFILNCGAHSCPALVPMDVDNTEELMRQATQRFIHENVHIDTSSNKVSVSRLWKWFRNDFTPDSDRDTDLMKWIIDHADKETANALAEVMTKEYKIKFAVYNWADNGDANAKPDIRFMAIYDLSFQRTA